MDTLRVGRVLRMLRFRRGWRLTDVSARSGISVSSLSRHEQGVIDSLSRIERHGRALDVRFDLRPVGRGADLIRTLDAEHAAIVNVLAASIQSADGRFELEASYSEWGERGRIDLLATHADRLIICEVKTELGDLQDLFGSLNIKLRLAPRIAGRLGMRGSPICLLAVASTERNRAVVAEHQALFASFRIHRFGGSIPLHSNRILLWVPPGAAGRRRWLAGQRRVRSSQLPPLGR